MYTLVKGYPSSSASPSDIWELNKGGQKYIAKIFESSSVLLTHEALIYSKVQKRIKYSSALFVQFKEVKTNVGISTLDNFIEREGTLSVGQRYRNLYENITYLVSGARGDRQSILNKGAAVSEANAREYRRLLEEYDRTYRFSVLVTRAVEGQMTLSKLINNASISTEQKMRTVCVLFYAIMCLSAVEINQNDMHWGNVLVTRVDDPYFIIMDGEVYFIEAPSYIPILFDFDRGVMKGENIEALRPFMHGGNCPSFHKNRDFFKALCFVGKYSSEMRPLTVLLDEILDRRVADFILRDRNCWLTTARNDSLYCTDEYMNQLNARDLTRRALHLAFPSFSATRVPAEVVSHLTAAYTTRSDIRRHFLSLPNAASDRDKVVRIARSVLP